MTPGTSPQAFFSDCSVDGVATFTNLGGDATLVSPCFPARGQVEGGYPHLASFLQRAPPDQVLCAHGERPHPFVIVEVVLAVAVAEVVAVAAVAVMD